MDALDSQIQHRKAKIFRLEATERDMEETIDSKDQQVKQLVTSASYIHYNPLSFSGQRPLSD